MSWVSTINNGEKRLRATLFVVSLLPTMILYIDYSNQALGINPFATISHTTGQFALIFILITLAITPVRRLLCSAAKILRLNRGKRLSDWNFLIKSRRQLGLFGFFYATLHLFAYLILDIDLTWEFFKEDWSQRSFILIGLIIEIMLLALAITSPNQIRKKMGKWWRKLHRLMYPIAILAVLHFSLSAKHGNIWPNISALICFLLLFHRFLIAYANHQRKKIDDGMEAKRR